MPQPARYKPPATGRSGEPHFFVASTAHSPGDAQVGVYRG